MDVLRDLARKAAKFVEKHNESWEDAVAHATGCSGICKPKSKSDLELQAAIIRHFDSPDPLISAVRRAEGHLNKNGVFGTQDELVLS